MAATTFGFRGKWMTVDDGDTVLAVYFMIREIRRPGSDLAHLEPWAADWQEAIEGQGPGTFDPDLDEHLTGREEVRSFFILVDRAEANLPRDFGDEVPAEFLNREVPPSGFDFYDYPTARIVRAMNNLRDLVLVGIGLDPSA